MPFLMCRKIKEHITFGLNIHSHILFNILYTWPLVHSGTGVYNIILTEQACLCVYKHHSLCWYGTCRASWKCTIWIFYVMFMIDMS